MKRALITTVIVAIMILVALQITIPIIDNAQAKYSAKDRQAFCLLREQSAQQ